MFGLFGLSLNKKDCTDGNTLNGTLQALYDF